MDGVGVAAYLPRAALGGCAASLCPGLTCFAPSGHGDALAHGRFPRGRWFFGQCLGAESPHRLVRSSSPREAAERLAVQFHAEPRSFGDRQIAFRVELERAGDNFVDVRRWR